MDKILQTEIRDRTAGGMMNRSDKTNHNLSGIVKELISLLKSSQIGIPRANGEWTYLNDNFRAEYLTSIYSRNWNHLELLLNDPLSFQTAYGMMTPVNKSKEYISDKDSNDFDSDIRLFRAIHGRSQLEELKHSNLLPHPFSEHTEKSCAYPDSPRHAHFAKKILGYVNLERIGIEIGGGYGGLIYYLISFGFRGKLINCDLLESLLVAYVFLRYNGISVDLCFTREEFILAQARKTEVILITPDLFDIIADLDGPAFVFNSRSLSEMSAENCFDYLKITNERIQPEFFMSENAEELLFPDSKRHVENIQEEIWKELTSFILIENSRTLFIGGSGRYTLRVGKIEGKHS